MADERASLKAADKEAKAKASALDAAAFRFLQRMQRADGSLRFSPRYATTPLWVSGQALPALERRPFPLR